VKSNEKYENPVYFLNFTLSNGGFMRKMEKAKFHAERGSAFSIFM
jgi:hypothetical protein